MNHDPLVNPAIVADSGPTTTRRKLLQIAGGAGVASLAASRLGRSAGSQDSASGWQGTITFYAQSYTPNSKLEGATILQEFQNVADEYQQAHPGVTIQFIDEEFADYAQTVRVKSAGAEMYDIFWAQWGQLNGTFPKGIARDLNPDFDAPNPYIEGGTPWRDAMNPTVLGSTGAPTGEMYNVNGDFVGTAFFYHPDLFTQAGITEAPTTWAGLLDTCQKLQDAGITPCAGFADFSWFGRHFLSDFYANDYDAIVGCDGSPGMSPQDEAAAINSGLLSTEDPRFLGWLPFFKQLTDFWAQEFLSQDLATVGDQIERDFASGQTAMLYTGSWGPNTIKALGGTFTVESFSFPVLSTDDVEFSTGTDTSGAVGGPNAAYQYAMSTPQSNKTMEEEGKEAAVLDFLQYIGTPTVIERVVNELGSFAPTWPGTTPNPGLETFVEQANAGLKVVGIGNSSAKLGPNMQRVFGLYLSGNIDDEGAKQQTQTELDAAVQDYTRTNSGVNLDECQ